jgi:hypothetical protein
MLPLAAVAGSPPTPVAVALSLALTSFSCAILGPSHFGSARPVPFLRCGLMEPRLRLPLPSPIRDPILRVL